MTGSGEKHAQDKNLIWCILVALRPILLLTVYRNTLYIPQDPFLGNTQLRIGHRANNGSNPTLCTNMKNEDALGFFSWEV